MIDQTGLYVETNGDAGDCPNRTGNAGASKSLLGQDPTTIISAVEKNLTVAPNIYCRYYLPGPATPPWTDPKDFSRDQATRLMALFGMEGRWDLVSGYYKLLVKNGFKHPNGDYLGIGEINNILRSINSKLAYPMVWIALVLCDLKFLGDLYFRNHTVTVSGLKVSITKGPVWGYDALMCADLAWTKKKYWTPSGWLCRKLYKKTDAKQQIYNNLIDPSTNGCIEAGLLLQEVFDKM